MDVGRAIPDSAGEPNLVDVVTRVQPRGLQHTQIGTVGIVHPWLDHPPLFALLAGGTAVLAGETTRQAASVAVVRIPVIVLSQHEEQEYASSALAAGAHGYVCKTTAPEELELAIDAVLEGKCYVSRRGAFRRA